MTEQVQAARFEPRWPVALTVIAVVVLHMATPGRIRLLPMWSVAFIGLAVLVPMLAVGLSRAQARWLRIERTVTLIFLMVVAVANTASLANLVDVLLNRSAGLSGQSLLASSAAVWVTNVLLFSMLYWQADRGGPDARWNKGDARQDWLFPQESAPAETVPIGWRPTFIDYLYLGFTTATAFSTTDVIPVTPRAKSLMMLESALSLISTVVVASRAINILR